ncbi:MarR family winged helix-turn-helix transcriptional regulator [Listeria booriae]|uniref:MarR family winged helix-turn-helix transcriptional regulator n=1 Tax=Listeria booriae TaxID=1552123 RepID=UPI001628B8D3|nr:MarR family transcriptional regulator [Listeria booriae]MBC2066518.1 MarR family transcriptional regulator [Listeria booriae]
MTKYSKMGIYLKRIDIAFDGRCNKMLKEVDMTHTQFKILMYMLNNQEKAMYQKDLETYFDLSNPTITGILNRLETKQFLKRVVSQEDARYRTIVLCPKTLNLEKKLKEIAHDMEQSLIHGLSKEEINQAFVLLEKMLNNITK